ncbi:MAG: hypothetical protein ACR2RB_06345 [Gammaproteobacteria bacterium]
MTKMEKTERKVVALLAACIENEKKQLSKARALAYGLSIVGGVLFGVSLVPAIQAEGHIGWFLGIGIVAGVLIGVSVHFYASLVQWPILRRFLDIEAIRKAHDAKQP